MLWARGAQDAVGEEVVAGDSATDIANADNVAVSNVGRRRLRWRKQRVSADRCRVTPAESATASSHD